MKIRRNIPFYLYQSIALVALLQGGGLASAQGVAAAIPLTNQQVIDAWKLQAGENQATPKLIDQPDGSIRLEWHGSFAVDSYRNSISVPPETPASSSPLRPGEFAKATLTTDFRAVRPDGTVNYLQGSYLFTNDRAASRYPGQLTNLQVGRNGPNFEATAGDTALAYSTLGSALGLRGIGLSRRLEDWTLSGFGGVVAESWEALANRATADGSFSRTTYLRNVAGVKMERNLATGLKVYATAQGFYDRAASLPEAVRVQPNAASRIVSTGLSFQDSKWSVAAELAASRYQEGEYAARAGSAGIVDAIYRAETWSARAGFHDVGPAYISLAQGIPAGIREFYAGLDWVGSGALTYGVDYRESISRPLSFSAAPLSVDSAPSSPLTESVPSQSMWSGASSGVRTQTLAGRANLNLASVLPGLGLALQASSSNNGSQGDIGHSYGNDYGSSNMATRSATLNFASSNWVLGATLGNSRVTMLAAAESDSRTQDMQLSVARSYSMVDTSNAPIWTLGWSLTGGRQQQTLTYTGKQVRTTTAGMTLTGQWNTVGQFNFSLLRSVMGQANGGEDLSTNAIQFDSTLTIGKQHTLKLYMQSALRNAGDATLLTSENSVGAILTLAW